jgi:hypothetical protein
VDGLVPDAKLAAGIELLQALPNSRCEIGGFPRGNRARQQERDQGRDGCPPRLVSGIERRTFA